jgi:hypothetical protein
MWILGVDGHVNRRNESQFGYWQIWALHFNIEH